MNDYRAYVENDYNSIYHFGIKGQKWGIRRYQNPDGSLTPEGKKRYLNPDGSLNERGRKELGRNYLKDRKYAGRVARGALGTAAAAAFAKEYGRFKFSDLAEKEKNAFVKNANKNNVFVKDIGLEDYDGNKHKIPVNAIFKNEENYEDIYKKINADQKKYKTPQQMKGFKETWTRRIKPDDLVNDMKRIDAKAIGRRKALVAGVLAAGIGATAISLYLHHKSVQKRKAEVERMLMGSDNSDSSVTKGVKEDWNNLSDKDFKAKYGVTKDKYAKRVAKYRDPYMNAPLAKIGKALPKKKIGNGQRGFAGDPPSWKETRIQQNKQGRVSTLKETVEKQNSIGRAPSVIPNFITDNFSKAESLALSRGSDYYVAYDPYMGGYIVRRRGR